jgi:uncharacterized protein (TIGR03663 family)
MMRFLRRILEREGGVEKCECPTASPIFKDLLRLLKRGVFIEGGILLLATLLRLWALDLKPPHFDEGINGWFVDQMRVHGFYHYDPENYHGPLYFYGLFVSLSLLGRNLWALRLPALLASIASVWVMLRLDRYFGTLAARYGALALALSPAAVFYGRYAIHESSVVLALLITFWGILGLWKEGERDDLIRTVLGITLLLLLKETALIHLGCFLFAAAVLLIWERLIPSQPAMAIAVRHWSWRDLALCCSLSLLALLFFYSGTFLNFGGVGDFFRAYVKWFHTGTGEGGHVKTDYQMGSLNYYWLALMARDEWPSLLGLGAVLRLLWPAPAMMRYLAITGIGVLLAYSLIPYKTPWCIISILWPFALLFGCAVSEGWEKMRWRNVLLCIPLMLLGSSLFMAWKLNFRHFADPSEPYVYVQTMPEIMLLTEPVLGIAQRDPRNESMSGQIILESYYPLPWIFGDFTNIGYYGTTNLPALLDGAFLVALSSEQKTIEERLKEPYLRRRFHLRDSMDECTVWFKESLFKNWFHEPGHGAVEKVEPKPSPSTHS